jgi:anti-sigma regulatory factor (Ser/Thr protein kinase)
VLQPFADEPAGPLADRREDDVALLLLSLDPAYAAERASAAAGVSRRTRFTVAQAEPDRIGDARHQLQAMLFDWESEDQVDGAVLMLSEMLTNVLVHTEGDAVVVAECSGSRGSRLLRVDVADTSDALPHRRSPGELASSGRGLMLMEMLAGTWGVDPSGEGKTIWFEMREDEPTPAWA